MKTANYTLIPMSNIKDEPRKIAIAWHESATDWIGDKHKLASDIQNYAESYALQVAEAVRDECARIAENANTKRPPFDMNPFKSIDLTTFIK